MNKKQQEHLYLALRSFDNKISKSDCLEQNIPITPSKLDRQRINDKVFPPEKTTYSNCRRMTVQ